MFGAGDKTIEKAFKNQLDKQSSFNVIALKNSVSGISSETSYENVVYAPQELTTDQHLRNLEDSKTCGTNFHKVLELLDYNDYDKTDKVNQVCKTYEVDSEKVIKALKILSQIFKDKTVHKENKFIMKVPYNHVVQSDITDEILVQGIIDAYCIDKENAIVVDFKLTQTKSHEKLKQRYAKQLGLYEMAIKRAYSVKNVTKYLLSLENGEIIKM